MRTIITSVVVSVLLGGFTGAGAQLPPEIMADRYLVQAERLMAEEDYKAALEVMNKIMALQREHSFTLPDGFHFKYARAAFSAGLIQAALDSLKQYLTASGRDGEFYRDALELLITAEPIQTQLDEYPAQVERLMAEEHYEAALDLMDKIAALHEEHDLTLPDEFRSKYAQVTWLTQPMCAGQPKGAACWMELANQPDCYVWMGNYRPDTTVTWTAECVDGLSQGTGTFTWVFDSEKTSEYTGSLQGGKRHGDWVERLWWTGGAVEEGPYVNGKRHGDWVVRDEFGSVEEVPYVNGKRHGNWVRRHGNGIVEEVPYVEGKRHGRWVSRGTHMGGGFTEEGSYVNGDRHGNWVSHYENWNGMEVTERGPYVEGKKHGRWVEFDGCSSCLAEGSYVNGKRHGNWVFRSNYDGKVSVHAEGAYVEGKKHGRWVDFGGGGDYVNGNPHGEWIMFGKRRVFGPAPVP